MILSIVLGYVLSRATSRRYLSLVVALSLGAVVGLLSAFLLVPLMYPLFVIRGTGVIVPEFRELVLCVFLPEFQVYSDVVPMWFPYSAMLGTTMVATSLLGAILGWWVGWKPAAPHTPWQAQE